jgi:hypothetical protein
MALTREQIESIDDLKPILVHVDLWNDDVFVKAFNPFDTVELAEYAQSIPVDQWFQAKMVARVLCDEQGVLLYDYQNEEDLKKLGKKNVEALKQIFKGCWTANGNTEESVEEAKKN